MTTRTPNEILSVLGFMETEAVQLSIMMAEVKKKHRGIFSERLLGLLTQINQLRWVMFMPDFNLSDAVIKWNFKNPGPGNKTPDRGVEYLDIFPRIAGFPTTQKTSHYAKNQDGGIRVLQCRGNRNKGGLAHVRIQMHKM